MKFHSLLYIFSLTAAQAVTISVNYSYDTNSYFSAGSPQRLALEAAATRWSNVLASNNLLAATIGDDDRIGFTHPGNGNSYQISGSTSSATDALVGFGAAVADEYGSFSLGADEWRLYAGGMSLTSAGVGGTGTGTNFTSVFTDPNSHINRGLNGSSPMAGHLPTWGGSISFDNDGSTSWDFDGDFYTVALHEIGHALGLSTSFTNVTQFITGTMYSGSNALAAYNADNGTSLTALDLVAADNEHWADNTYDSFVFTEGSPDYSGTTDPTGTGAILGDLNMEPVANFTPSIKRIELTNVDIGMAEDIGWTVVIPEPSSALLSILGLGGLAFRRNRKG